MSVQTNLTNTFQSQFELFADLMIEDTEKAYQKYTFSEKEGGIVLSQHSGFRKFIYQILTALGLNAIVQTHVVDLKNKTIAQYLKGDSIEELQSFITGQKGIEGLVNLKKLREEFEFFSNNFQSLDSHDKVSLNGVIDLIDVIIKAEFKQEKIDNSTPKSVLEFVYALNTLNDGSENHNAIDLNKILDELIEDSKPLTKKNGETFPYSRQFERDRDSKFSYSILIKEEGSPSNPTAIKTSHDINKGIQIIDEALGDENVKWRSMAQHLTTQALLAKTEITLLVNYEGQLKRDAYSDLYSNTQNLTFHDLEHDRIAQVIIEKDENGKVTCLRAQSDMYREVRKDGKSICLLRYTAPEYIFTLDDNDEWTLSADGEKARISIESTQQLLPVMSD